MLHLKGPVFPEPLVDPKDLSKLQIENAVSRLTYVGDAITMMRHMLDGKVPLIGFTGAPVRIHKTSSFFMCVRHLHNENTSDVNEFSVDFNGLYDRRWW